MRTDTVKFLYNFEEKDKIIHKNIEEKHKIKKINEKFMGRKFMGPVSKTRQFELFIFIKCVTIELVEANYIAKKVNV